MLGILHQVVIVPVLRILANISVENNSQVRCGFDLTRAPLKDTSFALTRRILGKLILVISTTHFIINIICNKTLLGLGYIYYRRCDPRAIAGD